MTLQPAQKTAGIAQPARAPPQHSAHKPFMGQLGSVRGMASLKQGCSLNEVSFKLDQETPEKRFPGRQEDWR